MQLPEITTRPDFDRVIQNGLLLLVLMVAVAYRFYGIDQTGLWGGELTNAGDVTHIGFLDMLQLQSYREIDPLGYKILLYIMTQCLGGSEFALRLLSATAGVGSVWMLVLLGRTCGSVQSGLLAAALLAGSYSAISMSQEVQVYGVLTLAVLVQCYVFLCLLNEQGAGLSSVESSSVDQSLAISIDRGPGAFSWRPPATLNSRCLIFFWVATLVLLSLSYAGIGIVLAECLLLHFQLRKQLARDAGKILRAVFVPVVLGFLVYLPVLVVHIQKVLPLLRFSWLRDIDAEQLDSLIFGTHLLLRWISMACCVFAIGFIGWQKFTRSNTGCPDLLRSLVFIVTVFLLFLLVSTQFFAYFHFRPMLLVLQPFLFLLAASFVFVLVSAFVVAPMLRSVVQWILLLLLLLCVMPAQYSDNKASGLFIAERKPDLRPAVKLIASDKPFLKGYRTVFLSNESVEYYLDRFNIRKPAKYVVNALVEDNAKKVDSFYSDSVFYYLDVIDSVENKDSSPVLDALVSRYGVLCISRYTAVRLVKFDTHVSPSSLSSVITCEKMLMAQSPVAGVSP